MPIGRESIRRSVRAPSLGAPDNVRGVADLIPRKILFGNPDRGSPEVAPDGRRLAHIEPVDDVLNVWVGDLDGDTAPGRSRPTPTAGSARTAGPRTAAI